MLRFSEFKVVFIKYLHLKDKIAVNVHAFALLPHFLYTVAILLMH